MKKLLWLSLICLVLILHGTASGQESGSFWIKSFEPGSSDLNDPKINREALARLDELMQDPTVEVTFLGAADSLAWRFEGKRVNPKVSEAWNDAKRLSRARVLQERYDQGHIGITHENIAGVKVVWMKQSTVIHSDRLSDLNDHFNDELVAMRADIEGMQASFDDEVYIKDTRTFNWALEAGLWSWRSGSQVNLVVPAIGLDIMIAETGSNISCQRSGAVPWESSEGGNS
jgi:hypothetical protein